MGVSVSFWMVFNIKEWAKSFYKSKRWQACRQAYIDKRINIDGGYCEECHERLGYIVHHKIMLTPLNISNPDVALNHCNLEYVCKECHDRFDGHGIGKGNKKKSAVVLFDSNGMPMPNDKR